MKTLLLIATLTLTLSSYANSKKRMSEAMVRSMNFKLQNIALNVSIDEEATFSCNNLTKKDVKDLQAIREDQKKVIANTSEKISKGRSISSLEISRLGTELGNRQIASKDMCPAIETNYQSQISRSLANTFPKEIRKCPAHYNEMREKYEAIISSSYVSNRPIKDACLRLVDKLQNLRNDYAANCGVSNQRPRKKIGTFYKVVSKR